MVIWKIDNSEFPAVGPSEFQLRVSHRLGQRDSVLCDITYTSENDKLFTYHVDNRLFHNN